MRPGPTAVNAIIALLCLIWGSTWIAIKFGLEDVPPLHGVALRFTLASVVLWAASGKLSKLEGGDPPPAWMVLVFGSLNFAVSYGIVYWSETVLPSALTAVLWAVFPMMMAVAGHLYLPGERLRPAQWLGFAIGFVGVALLFETDLRKVHASAVAAGAILLLSPLVSAVGQTCVKRFGEGTSSILLNRNGITLASAYMWLGAFAFERGRDVTLSAPAVASIVYLGLVGTCVAFGLFYWILRFTPAYKLSLIAYVTPLIAILLGWTLGEEPIHGTTLAGAALILGGVGLVRR